MAHAVRIVLVEPSHPGNIGSVARAMKNMGLADLWLVSPRQFPHAEATALASGAADLLATAQVVDSVPAALAGCGFVLGTTARVRTQYPWPVLSAREAALRAVGEAAAAPVALLFGPERTGLTNDHLALCHALVQIPTNPEYSSLNLAQAVLLLAYELRMAAGAVPVLAEREAPLPAVETLDHLYAHFDRVMRRSGFETHGNAAHVSRRVRRLLHRAVPDQQEVNLLRGFLAAVEAALPEAYGLPTTAAAARPYFDHAATTPLRPVARVAWLAGGEGEPDAAGGCVVGNPAASAHLPGRQSAAMLADARERLAACLGTTAASVVFTSGATEADNLAVLGAARGESRARAAGRPAGGVRGHILTARTEHKAVLEACAQLAREGFEVEYLPPAADGRVTPESVAAALRAETLLVSLMLVNNETGVVQDLRAISAVCRPRGVLVHTDAAQALGRIPLDVVALDVDLLSVSAHKCGGPAGIGALYVRRLPRPTLEPLLFGGGQEGGLRPGTQAVALASAFAAAATEAVEQQPQAMAAQREWAERLLAGLAGLPGWQQNGCAAPRVPTILSLTFDGVDGEALMLAMEPFAVASGAACSSAAREPSGVLRALGLDDARAESTLRISFGWTTTTAAVDGLARHLARVVSRLRALASAEAVGDAAGRVALADGLTEAAAPAGPYSRRLRQWVAAPLRAWVDSPLQGGAAECFEGSATDPASRTVVGFRAGADGQGGWRVRWTARGCPHVLGACEVMAETLERELVFRRRVCSTGTGGESGPPVTVPSMDLRSFAAAVDAPPDKLTRLLAVQEAAAALRRRYTAA